MNKKGLTAGSGFPGHSCIKKFKQFVHNTTESIHSSTGPSSEAIYFWPGYVANKCLKQLRLPLKIGPVYAVCVYLYLIIYIVRGGGGLRSE
jgi:hypothetical protein